MSQDEVDFLIGGDELFHHPRFEKHYSFMKEDYSPPNDKPIAFFMSCSKHKPFYKSPYRRVFYAMLKKLQIKDISQIYTVSEPAILVPEELDGSPVSMYDFPPEHLGKKGRELFVDRLATLLPKIFEEHKLSFYVLPKHHRAIFEDSLAFISATNTDINTHDKITSNSIIYAPPVIYNIPKARAIIEKNIARLQIIIE
jgi:predicted RNA-binding protein